MAAWALPRVSALLVAHRRAIAGVRVRQRDRWLLAQLGSAWPVLRGGHRRMARLAAVLRLADDAQFPQRRRGQRPAVLAVRVRAPGRRAAARVRPVVPHSAHQPRGGVSVAPIGLGHAARAAGARAHAAGDERRAGRPDQGAGRAGARLAAALHSPADLRHVGGHGVGLALGGADRAVRAAVPAAARGAGSGRGGRPGQLQRVPPLLRRLPLRCGDDGAAPQPAHRAPDGAGER